MSDPETEKWIDAGLAELARGGIDAVRVEVLAQRLKVTKGGFYRRFKDRPALLSAMLQSWADDRIAVIEQHMALNGATPSERLRSVMTMYAQRQNPQGIAIEIAIRQWARSDEEAAAAAERVDGGRMKAVEALYRALTYSPAEAEARAMLFYAFVFGEGLLFLKQGARKRAAMVAACADLIAT